MIRLTGIVLNFFFFFFFFVLNFLPTLTYVTSQTTLRRRPTMTYLLRMKKLRVREVDLCKATKWRGASPDLLRVYAFFLTCSISCLIFLVHNLFVVRKADFKKAKPSRTRNSDRVVTAVSRTTL